MKDMWQPDDFLKVPNRQVIHYLRSIYANTNISELWWKDELKKVLMFMRKDAKFDPHILEESTLTGLHQVFLDNPILRSGLSEYFNKIDKLIYIYCVDPISLQDELAKMVSEGISIICYHNWHQSKFVWLSKVLDMSIDPHITFIPCLTENGPGIRIKYSRHTGEKNDSTYIQSLFARYDNWIS